MLSFAPAVRAAQPEGAEAPDISVTTTGTPEISETTSPALTEAIEPKSPWRLELTAWAWIVGMTGDVGVRGQTAEVEASFADVLSSSDSVFALSGRVELGYGRWGAFVDGIYSKLGVEDQQGPEGGIADLESEIGLVDLGAMFRLAEWQPNGEAAKNPRAITLDLYAGARFTSLELKLSPVAVPSRSRQTTWVDPIIGAKLVLPFAERWHFQANGDIGGFGVESDFTWSTTALFGYAFHIGQQPCTVFGGYRAIGQDYSEGPDGAEFRWDIVQHGPILGLSVSF